MNKNGRNWLPVKERLTVYERDGYACVYCSLGINECKYLTLDHLTPRSKGGGHDLSNLVTCCPDCNDKRGDMWLPDWCKQWQTTSASVRKQARRGTKRNNKRAKQLLSTVNGYGSYGAVIAAIREGLT